VSGLTEQAAGWVEETHAQVARELGTLQESMLERVDRLGHDLATAPPDELAEVEGVQAYAEEFLVDAGQLLEHLANRLEQGLTERIEPMLAQAQEAGEAGIEARFAADRWRRDVQHYLTFVAQYVAGYVQGGSVALGLLLELPEGLIDRAVVTSIVRHRLMFAADRAELAATRWAEEVGAELIEITRRLDGSPAPAASPPPAASPEAPDGEGRNARLQRLLAMAEEHNIRIKKVPERPTDAFLDRMEEQLLAAAEKRKAAAAKQAERKQRLAELMDFAKELKVKLRKVPNNPSEAWLDKMEAKLVEVAEKRGVALPSSVPPTTEAEKEDTNDLAPAREHIPSRMSPAERNKRIAEMVAKAQKAKLELGTVPEAPTDDWVEGTEKKLDDALAQRKAERKAAREKKKRERQERIDRLKRMAEEAGIELGAVPKFPTDDWLSRMEMKVASARRPEESEGDDDRAGRLAKVLEEAEAAGVDLGDVPPDPDHLWLAWAEGHVDDAANSGELIAAGEDPDQEPTLRPRLVFEEGTVQEKIWLMEEGELTIGRARGNQIQIRDDSGVSRRHCTVFERDGGFFVRDNGSTKGTEVDGIPVDGDVPVDDGAMIVAGDTVMVFRV